LWIALIGLATAALLLDPPSLARILSLSVITAALTAVVMAVMTVRRRGRVRGGLPLSPGG